MLTTITPYWGRPEMLRLWLQALRRAHHQHVYHIVLVAGERIPDEAKANPNVQFMACEGKKGLRLSIGHYHNLGAQLANSTWIMKLDVDAFPNAAYFHELLPILAKAQDREWFNGGMFYLNRATSEHWSRQTDLLSTPLYRSIISDLPRHTASAYRLPAATNFICRRDDYLKLGGCSQHFIGYGWEDYQQIYMLERYWRGADPLPGTVDLDNVTERCRDEISRPKAKELFTRNQALALLHRWHSGSKDPTYKSPTIVQRNRRILLEYVQRARLITNCVPV